MEEQRRIAPSTGLKLLTEQTADQMKNILRMSLFIIARAGLSLAVAVWIASQWLSVEAGTLGCWLGFDEEGWFTHYVSFKATSGFNVTDSSLGNRRGFVNSAHVTNLTLSGITYQGHNGIAHLLSFRHWHTISLFAAFNIVLHFIYRKHPEGKPCEV
jgi:hypothetical protein